MASVQQQSATLLEPFPFGLKACHVQLTVQGGDGMHDDSTTEVREARNGWLPGTEKELRSRTNASQGTRRAYLLLRGVLGRCVCPKGHQVAKN